MAIEENAQRAHLLLSTMIGGLHRRAIDSVRLRGAEVAQSEGNRTTRAQDFMGASAPSQSARDGLQ